MLRRREDAMPIRPPFAVLPLLLLGAAEAQTTRYVAPCGDDAWTGLSPLCSAPDGPKGSIQAAIDASASGDTVLIAEGMYAGRINFGGRNITVRGAGIGRTVLDAQNTGTAVMFDHGEGPGAVLRGLTVLHGYPTIGVGVGAAAVVLSASPTFIDCALSASIAGPGADAGGVYLVNSTSLLVGCQITSNLGDGPASGVAATGGAPTLVNCYIAENSGIRGAVSGGTLTLRNCTIAVNQTTGANTPAGIAAAAGVANTIIWANGDASQPQAGPGLALTYCDVQGGYPGSGNIDVDPQLDGFRIGRGSPCVDAGDNTVFATYSDVAGLPRAVTTTGTRPGPGPGPLIDIGCFEVQPCYANCDGSTAPPVLNINDFICFTSAFATGCP
jgi:hypothetical protein